jgi:hypothetical protein
MDKPLRKLANPLQTECLCEHNHVLHRDGGASCGGGSSSSSSSKAGWRWLLAVSWGTWVQNNFHKISSPVLRENQDSVEFFAASKGFSVGNWE